MLAKYFEMSAFWNTSIMCIPASFEVRHSSVTSFQQNVSRNNVCYFKVKALKVDI